MPYFRHGMDDPVGNFSTTLGQAALARDWAAVHRCLAPWLRAKLTVAAVQAFFEDEYRTNLKANGIEDLHYPEYPEPGVGGNGFTNATELRKPLSWLPAGKNTRNVPPEVTDANMRYWAMVQLQCSDDQMAKLGFDHFAEIWLAVVETEEGLRVGYWSHGAY